jgi:hypothetical protein
MQPDHEADDLDALLHEEYGAPRLDDRFSADLIVRLQAEVAPTPTRARRSPLAICLGVATVAALAIAVVWISNLGAPGTNDEVAHRAKTDSTHSERPVESTEAEWGVTGYGVDNASLAESSRFETFVVKESLAQDEREDGPKPDGLVESLEAESADILSIAEVAGSKPENLQTRLSVISNRRRQWRNISAMVAHADMLYVVDSGRLYEVTPIDGSRRLVGDDDWQNTAAMGAAGGYLYIVSDNRLYEVNPTTGARRSLGKPDWAETEAIVTVGDVLYIARKGLLYRVNPNDGSREDVSQQNDGTNGPRKPKQ